jgi:hypothetical protein
LKLLRNVRVTAVPDQRPTVFSSNTCFSWADFWVYA